MLSWPATKSEIVYLFSRKFIHSIGRLKSFVYLVGIYTYILCIIQTHTMCSVYISTTYNLEK